MSWHGVMQLTLGPVVVLGLVVVLALGYWPQVKVAWLVVGS